jgi:thiamine-monophosphate kinase
MSLGEFEFINWVRSHTPPNPWVTVVGPGDDCAVLVPSGRPTLVTTDVLTEGVDFILAECGPMAVGWKAMAANLSDIAAMGGRPTAAVVGVVVPFSPEGKDDNEASLFCRETLASTGSPRSPMSRGKTSSEPPPSLGGRGSEGLGSSVLSPSLPKRQGEPRLGLLPELYLGLRYVADRFRVSIVGGDTNSWGGGLVVSVTVLGEPIREPVLRSGAKPGDWVFVTGPLGGSILGRHLTPIPRLVEAEKLITNYHLRAMIDISDGLAKDLGHINEESRCGAVLDAATIPIHPDAVELAMRTGKSPLEHALGDGEDFELIFTVSAEDGAKLLANPLISVWKVGEIVVEPGLWIIEGGMKRPLGPTGWEHRL